VVRLERASATLPCLQGTRLCSGYHAVCTSSPLLLCYQRHWRRAESVSTALVVSAVRRKCTGICSQPVLCIPGSVAVSVRNTKVDEEKLSNQAVHRTRLGRVADRVWLQPAHGHFSDGAMTVVPASFVGGGCVAAAGGAFVAGGAETMSLLSVLADATPIEQMSGGSLHKA
jgi:hypothetical protein